MVCPIYPSIYAAMMIPAGGHVRAGAVSHHTGVERACAGFHRHDHRLDALPLRVECKQLAEILKLSTRTIADNIIIYARAHPSVVFDYTPAWLDSWLWDTRKRERDTHKKGGRGQR